MYGPTLATLTRTRICPNCDGFATATITCGPRHDDGTRLVLHVDCRTCHGTGTVPMRPRLTTADVEVVA
ncbi:hypothetical protein [Streptomyces sp. NPDC048419]|uniref:hypothetical protein n=1 Tax=Streptomyces sp. NPDC048419 TaxID=3365547 RepID=UPI00371B6BB9